MPAPPEESEPAMVSAMGIVMVRLAEIQHGALDCPSPTRARRQVELPKAQVKAQVKAHVIGSFQPRVFFTRAVSTSPENAILPPTRRPPGDDRDGSLFRPVQMQTRPVLCR